jgi:hypothetical protein
MELNGRREQDWIKTGQILSGKREEQADRN